MNTPLPFTKVFRSYSRKDAVYTAMVRAIDCGPFDGGCVSFALALQRVYGGTVCVIDGTCGRSVGAQHAVLRLPDGRYVDAGTVGDAIAVVDYFNTKEARGQLRHAVLRALQDDDLPDAPRDEKLIAQLAGLFRASELIAKQRRIACAKRTPT